MSKPNKKNTNNLSNADRYRLEREQQVKDRQQAIIQTARELFLQNGIEKTTMLDLAKAAHISKVTLYRYFPDRPSVAIEVAISSLQEIRRKNLNHISTNPDPENQIRGLFIAMVDTYSELEEAYRFMAMFDNLYYASYPTPELHARYKAEVQNIFGNALDDLIADKTAHMKVAQIITFSNMIVSFLQRLALRGALMSTEQMVPVEIQLQIFRKAILDIADTFQ